MKFSISCLFLSDYQILGNNIKRKQVILQHCLCSCVSVTSEKKTRENNMEIFPASHNLMQISIKVNKLISAFITIMERHVYSY